MLILVLFSRFEVTWLGKPLHNTALDYCPGLATSLNRFEICCGASATLLQVVNSPR